MDIIIDRLQTKINEAKALLRKESREAIDAVNWKYVIQGINEKYSTEQIEDLTTETELLLCGLLKTEDYPKELQTSMLLTRGEVDLLINQLDILIFKKIQAELEKRIFGKRVETPASKPLVIDPRFLNMPKDIQEAIARSDWRNKLYEISKNYKINIEQKGILEDLTVRVIQNTIHPDKYESEVASKITLPTEDIFRLVKDVNENILKVIRDLMENGSKEQVVSSKEEEVPLPPYGKIITNDKLLINNEKPKDETPVIPIIKKEPSMQVYGVIGDEGTPTKVRDELKDAWPTKQISPTPTTDSAPKIVSKSMMDEKLKSVTMSDHSVSDYSTPKIASPSSSSDGISNPSLKSHDPYREEF